MSEQLLISVSDFETRVALTADGVAQEIHLARSDNHGHNGNIYFGRVVRIVPGMQAAFVDIGLERPGFLHVRDIEGPRLLLGEAPVETPDIRALLHDGQRLMVQVAKDPIAGKGARLTTRVAIAARCLVLMPFNEHIGISQKIDDEAERERLRELIAEERQRAGVAMGFIARTAADGATEAALRADVAVLTRIWDRILAIRGEAAVPACLYQELPLPIRVVRDMVGPRLERIVIDHEPTFDRVRRFADECLPGFAERISLDLDPRPLFERSGIDAEIDRLLSRRVDLRCGGYLIIEQTEAMTTVDVNTGGFLGTSSLEDTVYRTNLEAAQVIPRQLRLRNLGGIVVVDFIDMQDEAHQREVLRVLEEGFAQDPARVRCEGFSSLGLVQLSRKRTRESLLQQICEPCDHCAGAGMVKTAETACAEIFRAIVQDARARCGVAPPDSEYLVRAADNVVDRLLDEEAGVLERLSVQIGRPVRIQVEPSYGPAQFDVVLVQDMRGRR